MIPFQTILLKFDQIVASNQGNMYIYTLIYTCYVKKPSSRALFRGIDYYGRNYFRRYRDLTTLCIKSNCWKQRANATTYPWRIILCFLDFNASNDHQVCDYYTACG
ncbi:hypothetical protein D3C71_1465000 [compost metagenome]